MDIKLFTQNVEMVPTSYYYYTDKNTPSKCVPRVDIDPTKLKPEEDEHTVHCYGDDGEHDLNSGKDTKKWQTKHDGRPQPMKLTNFTISN